MKRAIIILLVMALMLAGCAPAAPVGAEAVQSQTQSAPMENKLSSETDSLSTLKLPEKFTGDWTGLDDCFIVHADATVQMPELSAVPTATVTRKHFPQEDVDKLLEVFLKGNTLYKEGYSTKQSVEAHLEKLRAMLNGDIPLSGDATIEGLPDMIAYYEEILETAPDENEKIPASTSFQREVPLGATVDPEYKREEISGYADVDGRKIHVRLDRDETGWETGRIYVDGYGDANGFYTCDMEYKGSDGPVSEDDAKKIGDALLEQLGFSDVVCCKATSVSGAGYALEYSHTLAGQAVNIPGLMGTSVPENTPVAGIWGYETIRLLVNSSGVVYFEWLFPQTEPVILEENNKLLPFSDIAKVFSKMIFVTNDYWRQANEKNGFDVIHNIDVDKVELNFMRIRDKDNLNEGTIVPVWDFWATTKTRSADEEHRDLVHDGEYYEVVLTINAIDGTVIDRAMGY